MREIWDHVRPMVTVSTKCIGTLSCTTVYHGVLRWPHSCPIFSSGGASYSSKGEARVGLSFQFALKPAVSRLHAQGQEKVGKLHSVSMKPKWEIISCAKRETWQLLFQIFFLWVLAFSRQNKAGTIPCDTAHSTRYIYTTMNTLLSLTSSKQSVESGTGRFSHDRYFWSDFWRWSLVASCVHHVSPAKRLKFEHTFPPLPMQICQWGLHPAILHNIFFPILRKTRKHKIWL